MAGMSPSDLAVFRRTALMELRTASSTCSTRSSELLASAPPHCQQVLKAAGSGPNLGLVEWLVDSMDWNHKNLVRDLVFGFRGHPSLPRRRPWHSASSGHL